jgi:CRISPR-associated protein Csm2
MTQSPNKPNSRPNTHQSSQNQPSRNDPQKQGDTRADVPKSDEIVTIIVSKIDGKKCLKDYKIQELVEDTERLGQELVRKGLKTNQIRKFLDAVKRFKVQKGLNQEDFEKGKDELHILRYQLAYAAARQQKNKDPGPVEPLKKVLEAAIKKVNHLDDFHRFVQLIESIVAYHKAAGGKDQ